MRNISLKILAAAMTAMISGTFTAAHADDFKAEVKYAQVGDVKIAYYTRGQGAPLLMISGYASTMSIWDPELLELLSQNHTLIMYDHRGVGLSTDTAENNTTIPQMADDGAGLLKAIGYEKADILG
jgi:pimeloyl-ACP methyl ester carboxylesterase